MKKCNFLISLFLLTGFFISAQTGATIIDSIYSNSIYRTYRLYVPTIYNATKSVPLILNLHGYTSNAISQQFYGNFMPISDTANFLVVHPQGTKDGSNQPYWNAGISTIGANDVLFLSQLIDTLKTKYNIDANCVYSTGLSNGGFMSNYLACNLSSKIAAIASVAGTMFTNWNASCNPGRPVPAMHIHGTADGTVPYAGNSTMIAADSLVKTWRVKNNCNVTPVYNAVPNINLTDGCTADHYVYTGGNNNSSVELYRVNGGGHTWPGATIQIGVTNQDFKASVEIWRFFRKYKLNTLTSISNNFSDSELSLQIYPNPTNNLLFIKSNFNTSTSISDINGKLIIDASNAKEIDLSQLNAGIYFAKINCNNFILNKKIVKLD